jgi:hypothetical protein
MSKQRKPLSAKKPPLPNNNHELIEEWMNSNVMPAMQDLVKEVDALIRSKIPNLHFAIKWGYAYYGTEELGWLIELTPFAVSTNVVFLNSADFDPKPPLGEGQTRYVKLKHKNELLGMEVDDFMEQAGKTEGWK